MTQKPIVLLVSGEYPPYTAWGGNAYQFQHLAHLLTREGCQVEVIAESDNGEEFTHLDDVGNLVHRISAGRSYLYKSLEAVSRRVAGKLNFGNLSFAARVLEKTFELSQIWSRRLLWIESTNWRAETFFFHFFPQLNDHTIVRIVTPYEEVVRQNGIDRGITGVQVHLFSEMLQQILLKNRIYSNADYKSFFEARVRTSAFGIKRAKEKTFLLPFDFDRIARRKKDSAPRKDEVLRLVMVGRVEHRKGFDLICSALAGLTPNERKRISIQAIGRDVDLGPFGSYKKMLYERFPGIADVCFEWLGTVSNEVLQTKLGHADAGLVASTSESFGYNLLELLAADLPVIASDVGATSEFERRGIRYCAKFRSAAELTEVFADLPRKLRDYESAAPNNRQKLKEIYEENDRAYMDFVRREVSVRVADIAQDRKARLRSRPIQAVDIVCCSYNRFDELTISLPSILREVEAANAQGLRCRLTIVYQNPDLPERIYEWRPDWKAIPELNFVPSSPPGLTRARNVGIAATSGDLVIFVDDDVVLDPGFVIEHVKAANQHPQAIGVAGRLRSKIENDRTTEFRAVGQIRLSGYVDSHFDSVEATTTLVPQTPMGANMSFKRAPMFELYGNTWFDERMPPAAFRDETLLCTELFRAGEHLVYAPNAVLYHFESAVGGCGFRSRRSIQKLVDHFAMDYLFLNKLYEPISVLRHTAPLLLLKRDLIWATGRRSALKKLIVNVGGFFSGRALYSKKRPLRLVHPEPPSEPELVSSAKVDKAG